jgi:hypothetical protein
MNGGGISAQAPVNGEEDMLNGDSKRWTNFMKIVGVVHC